MDPSTTHESTINLGKQLVEALERDHRNMPVTHWMAHYIAELMVKSESSFGEEKEAAQKKCFEAILILWKHRAALPDGVRPFEAFESVIKTLDRLNPENQYSWLARIRSSPESCDTETKKLLHIMESLDHSARSIMSVLLNVAVESCQDEETLAYLQNAHNEFKDKHIQVVERIIDHGTLLGKEKLDEAKRQLIMERLEHLDRFLSGAKMVRKIVGQQLPNE